MDEITESYSTDPPKKREESPKSGGYPYPTPGHVSPEKRREYVTMRQDTEVQHAVRRVFLSLPPDQRQELERRAHAIAERERLPGRLFVANHTRHIEARILMGLVADEHTLALKEEVERVESQRFAIDQLGQWPAIAPLTQAIAQELSSAELESVEADSKLDALNETRHLAFGPHRDREILRITELRKAERLQAIRDLRR